MSNNMSKKLHYVQSEHNPQATKELNAKKPEWMPVNPCPCGCIRYPDGHKCYMEDDGCVEIAKYEGAIVYQKKLLKFLHEHEWYTKIIPQGKGQRIISKKVGISQEFVEAMLKQLEDK